mmetsp:Transcript_3493/g.21953  ORF Transcript_3493/g.21953 Transcript_3493/m.21953 type:complete len:163 (+) Transcript_3493:2117-2605(+)
MQCVQSQRSKMRVLRGQHPNLFQRIRSVLVSLLAFLDVLPWQETSVFMFQIGQFLARRSSRTYNPTNEPKQSRQWIDEMYRSKAPAKRLCNTNRGSSFSTAPPFRHHVCRLTAWNYQDVIGLFPTRHKIGLVQERTKQSILLQTLRRSPLGHAAYDNCLSRS